MSTLNLTNHKLDKHSAISIMIWEHVFSHGSSSLAVDKRVLDILLAVYESILRGS